MITCDMMRRAYGLSNAEEIVRGIFVGSIVDGMDFDFAKTHDIGLVVNCTKEDDLDRTSPNYLQIPVDDDLTFGQDRVMYGYLGDAVRAIDAEKKNVLIHCFAGQQRSAAVACAYLMWKGGATFDDAVARIRKKKPDAFQPGINFKRALLDFESDIMFEKIL